MSNPIGRCRLLYRIQPWFPQPRRVSDTRSIQHGLSLRHTIIERQYFQSVWKYPRIPVEISLQSVWRQDRRLLHGTGSLLQLRGKEKTALLRNELVEAEAGHLNGASPEQSMERPGLNDDFYEGQGSGRHGSWRKFSRMQDHDEETASEFGDQGGNGLSVNKPIHTQHDCEDGSNSHRERGGNALSVEESIHFLLDSSDGIESQQSWSRKILEKASQMQRQEAGSGDQYTPGSIYEQDVDSSDDDDSDEDESDDFEDSGEDDDDTDEDDPEDMHDYCLARRVPRHHEPDLKGEVDLDFDLDLDENVDLSRQAKPTQNKRGRNFKPDMESLFLKNARKLQKSLSDTDLETELLSDLHQGSKNARFHSVLKTREESLEESPSASFFLEAKKRLKEMSRQAKKIKRPAVVSAATGQ